MEQLFIIRVACVSMWKVFPIRSWLIYVNVYQINHHNSGNSSSIQHRDLIQRNHSKETVQTNVIFHLDKAGCVFVNSVCVCVFSWYNLTASISAVRFAFSLFAAPVVLLKFRMKKIIVLYVLFRKKSSTTECASHFLFLSEQQLNSTGFYFRKTKIFPVSFRK